MRDFEHVAPVLSCRSAVYMYLIQSLRQSLCAQHCYIGDVARVG